MYDLLAISTADLATVVGAGAAVFLLVGGFVRWVLGNVRNIITDIATLKQARRDAATQNVIDVSRIENKLDTLDKKIDSYFRDDQ